MRTISSRNRAISMDTRRLGVIGGLLDVLLPSLYFGVRCWRIAPANRSEEAFALIGRHGVRNASCRPPLR